MQINHLFALIGVTVVSSTQVLAFDYASMAVNATNDIIAKVDTYLGQQTAAMATSIGSSDAQKKIESQFSSIKNLVTKNLPTLIQQEVAAAVEGIKAKGHTTFSYTEAIDLATKIGKDATVLLESAITHSLAGKSLDKRGLPSQDFIDNLNDVAKSIPWWLRQHRRRDLDSLEKRGLPSEDFIDNLNDVAKYIPWWLRQHRRRDLDSLDKRGLPSQDFIDNLNDVAKSIPWWLRQHRRRDLSSLEKRGTALNDMVDNLNEVYNAAKIAAGVTAVALGALLAWL